MAMNYEVEEKKESCDGGARVYIFRSDVRVAKVTATFELDSESVEKSKKVVT